jgi:hypothetical protein
MFTTMQNWVREAEGIIKKENGEETDIIDA